MDQVAECRRVATGVEGANVLGRPRTHHRHQLLDRVEHAADAAKRERCRAEADDLTIVGALVAAHDLNRIGGGVGVIEILVQPIERGLQRGKSRPVSQGIVILTCEHSC